jgi:O-antigen/teichoic acid export membrane protein
VVAMLSIVLPALALYVARGCLQGAQRFGALAANSVLESVVRLVGGIALVALGWGASGGLLALTLGSAGALILALASLRPLLQERAPRLADKDGQPAFFVLAFAGFLAFATLTNVDTALVRHYFAPQPAGEYAAVATLGRTVLFFPTSIATVMFPKTAGQHIRGLATYATLGKSVAATVTLCLIPVTGMILWARPLLLWSYGEAYVGGAGLLGFYGITMGIYALMSLLLQYFLSVNDGRFVVALLAVAASSLAGIGLFHASMTQVVGVMATVGGLAVTVGVFLCAFPVNRGHRA